VALKVSDSLIKRLLSEYGWEKGKAKKRKPIERTNKAQSERFIKAAKELEVDETGQAFERAIGVLLPIKPKAKGKG
jgi:hypothetical protein